jgi:hypothetical protein
VEHVRSAEASGARVAGDRRQKTGSNCLLRRMLNFGSDRFWLVAVPGDFTETVNDLIDIYSASTAQLSLQVFHDNHDWK